jgi:flagellar biosynthesis/type III secretory pathway protein FliH
VADAIELDEAAQLGRSHPDAVAADKAGRAEAHRRQDEQHGWTRRHDRDRLAVSLVREAVENGDPKITDMVAKGRYDEAARRALEQERQRQAEAERQRQIEAARRQAALEQQRRLAAARAPRPTEPTYTGPRFR